MKTKKKSEFAKLPAGDKVLLTICYIILGLFLVGDDRQIFHDDQTAAAPEGRLRTVMAVFQDDGLILINAKMGNGL